MNSFVQYNITKVFPFFFSRWLLILMFCLVDLIMKEVIILCIQKKKIGGSKWGGGRLNDGSVSTQDSWKYKCYAKDDWWTTGAFSRELSFTQLIFQALRGGGGTVLTVK